MQRSMPGSAREADPLRGASWNESVTPHALRNFSELFRIVRPLGRGSFGQTWLVRSRRTGMQYVLKVLHAEVDPEQLASEVGALQAISRYPTCREHIVCYYGVFTMPAAEATRLRRGAPTPASGRYALLMEFVPGRSLQTIADEDPAAWERQWRSVVDQLLAVLSEVHALGYAHRDVKPDNIMLGPDGKVTLIDFGIACRETPAERALSGAPPVPSAAPGTAFRAPACPRYVIGPPSYTAPEALRGFVDAQGQPTDPGAADLYSLGGTMYALSEGRLPPPARANGPPPVFTNPDIEPCRRDLITSLLAYDWHDRPTPEEARRFLREQCPAAAPQ